jgi:hypothetical protein
MRNKLFIKLGILMLAVIFLMSMVSYSTAQGKGQSKGKPEKPDKPGKPGGGDAPELYKVSISINDGAPGFEAGTCGFDNYFYAVGQKGKYLLNLESDGIETPGPNGELAEPLTMWVNTGNEAPIWLEGCFFEDLVCHGNLPGYDPGYDWIFIQILKSQDGEGPNEDIRIRWFFDRVPVPKLKEQGWDLYSLPGEYNDDDMQTVKSTALFPLEGLGLGEVYETDVIGPFWLLHRGIGCDPAHDPTDNRLLLHDFNIHLKIERVQ